jgi:hypothetical protein
VAEKDERGMMVTGDSGEDEGDGSVNEDESAVEMVVVGEDSVDSDACVDVESRCLCCGLLSRLTFSCSCGDRLVSSGNVSNFVSAATLLLPIRLGSKPYTLINDGNWL